MVDTPVERPSKRKRAGTDSTSPPPNGNAPVISLAPSGDIIFVLNNGTRLLVYSVVLRLASPVFRAMFGPHFSEGQDISSDSPKEVPLPEDDPEAIQVLLGLLHHAYDHGEVPSMGVLREFAMLVDKYDCLKPVRSTVEKWLTRRDELAKFEDYKGEHGALLGIAARLDLAELFFKISKSIMLSYRKTLFFLPASDLLPPGTTVVMAEEIAKTGSFITRDILDDIGTHLRRSSTSSSHRICRQALFSTIVSQVMERFICCNNKGLQDITHWFDHHEEEFNDVWEEWKAKASICAKCKDEDPPENLYAGIKDSIDTNVDELEGICLDCLKRNGLRDQHSVCRVCHDRYTFNVFAADDKDKHSGQPTTKAP